MLYYYIILIYNIMILIFKIGYDININLLSKYLIAQSSTIQLVFSGHSNILIAPANFYY